MDGIIFLLLALTLYFMPTVIAWNRNHKNLLPIFFVNLFLGWTLLGWIAALVWSATN